MTFEEYVRLRGPALVRLARLLTGDPHRGEDLAQEVLARAFVRWRRISRTERPDVYIRRMLVNAHRSWWRRRSNHEQPHAVRDDRSASGDISAQTAERYALWQLITALPVRQRAVLVLRYYEDLDDAAVAEILGCSTVTVRTHAMRALAKVRERATAGLDPVVLRRSS